MTTRDGEGKTFALLQRPVPRPASDEDLDRIHPQAIEYLDRLQRSGVKSTGESRDAALQPMPNVKTAAPTAGGKGPRFRHEIIGSIGRACRLGGPSKPAPPDPRAEPRRTPADAAATRHPVDSPSLKNYLQPCTSFDVQQWA